MEDTLQTLNRMVSSGVIEQYAIAGAVAAAYYVPPTMTEDLDVLVPLQLQHGLVDMSNIKQFMDKHNHPLNGVGYLVGKWLVQFLPVGDALSQEALAQSREVQFGRIPTRILTAEHLAAIMLQVGRPKDFVRLANFWASGRLDRGTFAAIIQRHGLMDKWQKFLKRNQPAES